MFNVGNNLLGSPIPPLGTGPPVQLAGAAAAAQGAAANALADAISPTQQPGANAGAQPGFVWPGSGNGPGGFIAQFMSIVFGAFTQLAQYLSSTYGQPPWQPAPWQPGPSPLPGQPGGFGGPGNPGQQFFTSATASSTGDPHDTFCGTTASGQQIDGGRWDSMTNHPYLLTSDSFAGGFRVSTNVTPPNEKGVTQNDYVSVASDFGRNVVTMNKDGSFSVVQNGKSLDLGVGQTQSLGNGETVTLNADRSLSVVAQNGYGGEITTTLRANGEGGVNVRASAQNVDLGGYLVNKSEGFVPPGVPIAQPNGHVQPDPTQPLPQPIVGQPLQPQPIVGQPLQPLPILSQPLQPQPYQPSPYQPYQPQPYHPYQGEQATQADPLVGV